MKFRFGAASLLALVLFTAGAIAQSNDGATDPAVDVAATQIPEDILALINDKRTAQELSDDDLKTRAKAARGDAMAQVDMAEIYATFNGVCFDGVRKDDTESNKWYRKAAEQGDATAQFNLGIYYHVRGMPKDYAQAAQWYRKAADQGDASAQVNLGGMYNEGDGVPQSYAQAVFWYRKAAAQADTDAQLNLGSM